MNSLTQQEILDGIKSGDRVILAKAITLIESKRPHDQKIASEILGRSKSGSQNTIRIGVTGTPGAGKSTFIEALGLEIISRGNRLAVLTIDPTSIRSRGSILGDKTRMQQLSMHKDAFIRPSPSGNRSGGVANRTRETVRLCEAAGFNVILIETLGVGQGETEVGEMVDINILLTITGGGDELQGIKRGIMELADIVVINKADGDNIKEAKKAALQYQEALKLFPKQDISWTVPVISCSALMGTGIEKVWDQVRSLFMVLSEKEVLKNRRKNQDFIWFKSRLREKIEKEFYADEKNRKSVKELEQKLKTSQITIEEALKAL